MLKKLIKNLIPNFIVNAYHYMMAFLGALVFGFSSKKLKIIGVTGTNGKSTTVMMICRILEEAGYKVGSVSSIWFKIGEKEIANPLHMTMPGRFRLQSIMRQMVKQGCQYAVLEVTSEGVLQHRHKFINFETAVFTNLSPEHIEHHGGFEKYREAKGKFFESVKGTHIINLDDENAEYFLKFLSNKKIGYSTKIFNFQFSIFNFQTIVAQNIRELAMRNTFLIDKIDFILNLPGQFNVYNALAAVCVGMSQGVSLETVKIALAKVQGVAGRMEIVQKEPFLVIVDLAHTPPAVEKVYETCRAMLNSGAKMITVFGAAGGGRDKWKRPELGKLASKYCDIIIITNEDPYDENPEEIINDIIRGVPDRDLWLNKNLFKVADRKQAIQKAISFARDGDIVLFLGKGTEATMVFAGGRKIAWDERKIIKETLQAFVNIVEQIALASD